MTGGTLGPEQIFKWKQMLREMAPASQLVAFAERMRGLAGAPAPEDKA